MVFHWSLSDYKSRQVAGTFLSILADLNNVVVLMVLIRLPISNSSSLLIKPLETVTSVPITSAITVTMFHSFFSSLARSKFWYFISFP